VSAEIAAPPRIAPPIAGRKRGWLKHRSLVIGGGLLALIVLVAILAR
jgi:hypothetical protein